MAEDKESRRKALIRMYWSGLSCKQISEDLGDITKDGVRYWIRKEGIVRPSKEAQKLRNWRIYSLDENTFERPLSKQTAWALGVIIGDGCVMRHKASLRGVLVLGDEDVCTRVGAALEAATPVFRVSEKKIFALQLYSPRLAESLARYGVHPSKSRTVAFPDLPAELVPHFVRGLWDADGCVTTARKKDLALSYVSASPSLLEGVLSCMRTVSGTTSKAIWSKDNTGIVQVKNRKAEEFGKWLWADSNETCRGERKFARYVELAQGARCAKVEWVKKCAGVRQEALKLYLEFGLLPREVGPLLGVDKKSVERWVREAGVGRGKSENQKLAWTRVRRDHAVRDHAV